MRRFSLPIIMICCILAFCGCSSQPAVSDLPPLEESSPIPDLSEITRLYKAYQAEPENRERLLSLTSAYQELGDDKSCEAVYKQYLELVPGDAEILVNLAYVQMNLGDYDEAQLACEKAIGADKTYISAYNALGNIYGDKTEYNQAVRYYQMALKLNQDYTPAKTNILWALYHGAQYERCITEAQNQLKQGFEGYDVYYYLGACYEATNLLPEAQKAYLKALDYSFDDHSTTYYHLGWLAFLNEDYGKALKYNDTALSINPRNKDALWLSELLEERQLPLSSRLARFIQENYLYAEAHSGFNKGLEALESHPDASAEESVLMAGEALNPYDPFSFILTGTDYEEHQEVQDQKTVTHSTQELDGISYELFTIDTFNQQTGREFISKADALKDRENKVLVFDVRGNTGGDMRACADILDYLLGECAVVNFIDRKGNVNSYYSSADRVAFKKILVLTDKNTASAAELLPLSLKVYLPETVIIGDVTFGKGVCQIVFDEPQDKMALYLVNTYWNVREINIGGYGVSPDIKAVSEMDFELAIKNALNVVQ